jgi:hypothetical protein
MHTENFTAIASADADARGLEQPDGEQPKCHADNHISTLDLLLADLSDIPTGRPRLFMSGCARASVGLLWPVLYALQVLAARYHRTNTTARMPLDDDACPTR